MKLYFSIIGTAIFVISAANIIFKTAPWDYVVVAVIWCAAMQFLLDGIVALVINKLPDKLFGVDNPMYAVSEIEKEFYKKIKVKNWKDKVWELGALGGFSKKSLKMPTDLKYIEKFIIECNKGVLTHRIAYLTGFIPMLLIPGIGAFSIALPVGLVNLFLSILPTLVLRYNTPKLKLILEKSRKRKRN